MELVIFLIFVYGITRAWQDSKAAYRKSKSAYMGNAARRFPDAPKSHRAAWALRHDAGYWASQTLGGFPAARHGFASGWHQGRDAQISARTAREEARTRRLENQAGHAESLSGFRERQQEALRRWREAMNADRERATEGTVAGEGSEGSREGAPVAPSDADGWIDYVTANEDGTVSVDTRRADAAPRGEGSAPPQAAGVPEYEGGTYSWGPANSPYGWPAQGDADKAHHYARRMSAGGNPQVVTVYPPGGGPGTTVATYLDDQEIEPTDAQRAEWWAEAEEERRRHPATFGAPSEADQQESPVSAQAAPSTEGNDMNNQVTPYGNYENLGPGDGGIGSMAGSPGASDTTYGGVTTGTIGSNNAYVREYSDVARNAGGVMPASEVTYDSIIADMGAAKADAENKAAEQQQAVNRASAAAEHMQGADVDTGTLSVMSDYLDAQDAALRALNRVQEAAATVEATLRRSHAGLNEAHQNAPVTAADRGFYQG